MRTGSLVNLIQGNETRGQPTPEVGMAATILMWTDRHAATIVEVSANGKRIAVQEDFAIRIDSNGLSESQSYRYERNRNARLQFFTLRKNGAWVRQAESKEQGTRLRLGSREEYRDPSF